MRIPFVLSALILVFSLCACSAPIIYPPATGFTSVGAPLQEYRIQPGDQLDLKFFYNPELNEQVIVRPDGKISLQLVKEMQAAGLTPAQLDEQLTTAYGRELKKPEVAVILRTFNAYKVFVDGEVTKPGLVVMASPTTVLQSIAQAGGMKDTARPSEVIIIRKGADAKPIGMVVNLEDAIAGADPSQDIELKPYDIVYVPKSAIANVNTWLDLYIKRNIPIPIGFGFGY